MAEPTGSEPPPKELILACSAPSFTFPQEMLGRYNFNPSFPRRRGSTALNAPHGWTHSSNNFHITTGPHNRVSWLIQDTEAIQRNKAYAPIRSFDAGAKQISPLGLTWEVCGRGLINKMPELQVYVVLCVCSRALLCRSRARICGAWERLLESFVLAGPE